MCNIYIYIQIIIYSVQRNNYYVSQTYTNKIIICWAYEYCLHSGAEYHTLFLQKHSNNYLLIIDKTYEN